MKLSESTSNLEMNFEHSEQQIDSVEKGMEQVLNTYNIGEIQNLNTNRTVSGSTEIHPYMTKSKSENVQNQPAIENEIEQTLFDRNAELFCNIEQKWMKTTVKLVTLSDDLLTVGLSMATSKGNFQELVTDRLQLQHVNKTTVKWSSEDVSQEKTRISEQSIRFKTSKIAESFLKAVSKVQKKIMTHRKKCGKYSKYITNCVLCTLCYLKVMFSTISLYRNDYFINTRKPYR